MAIIGFIFCFLILSYLLAVCIVGFCGVNFSIQMGGGKSWHYWFPVVGLIVVMYLLSWLFEYSPFTITML